MYTVDGLTHGIERAKHNIDVLKKAIEDEEKTIRDYRSMIHRLEEVEEQKAEAEKNIHIEIDGDS